MTSTATAENAIPATRDFDLVARYYRRDLFRYAYRLSGNHHTAEDLVQESLTRAWRSFDHLQDLAAVKGWLYTIVRRENARRHERRQAREIKISAEEIATGHKTYDTSIEAFALRRAIGELPAEYRIPLILQVIHGYSQKEIAMRLGLTSAGVGTRLFRARQKMRAALLGEQA